MKKYIFLPLLLAFCFVCGMIIAHMGMQKSSAPEVLQKDTKLETILNLIETEYVDKVDRKKIIENAIPYFLENLDPHTEYIPSQDYANLKEPIQGEFEGIGVQFNIVQDTVVIIQVITGGPSELVGLQAGDRIIAVEDSVIAGKKISTDEVVRLLKGPKGTEVTVSIHRQSHDSLTDFTITRNTIPLYSIDASYMIDDSIGYIKISRFAMTTTEEFMNHMAKLSTQGMTSVIIDLRENGGGVLDAALFLANEFLNKDDLILFTQGKHYARENYFA
ncbi:MAG: S41 family peptidase, partial [Bacteroidota bacterium]